MKKEIKYLKWLCELKSQADKDLNGNYYFCFYMIITIIQLYFGFAFISNNVLRQIIRDKNNEIYVLVLFCYCLNEIKIKFMNTIQLKISIHFKVVYENWTQFLFFWPLLIGRLANNWYKLIANYENVLKKVNDW